MNFLHFSISNADPGKVEQPKMVIVNYSTHIDGNEISIQQIVSENKSASNDIVSLLLETIKLTGPKFSDRVLFKTPQGFQISLPHDNFKKLEASNGVPLVAVCQRSNGKSEKFIIEKSKEERVMEETKKIKKI